MEDKRTAVEKLIAGEVKSGDYNLDSDFDDEELRTLLDAGVIQPRDLSDPRASDMVIHGVLSYDEYPFEKFSNDEKIRQLEQNTVSLEEFKSKAELVYFDGDDWLALLEVRPELDAEAPWDMIRRKAHADRWFAFLSIRPEHADAADWKRLCEQGTPEKYFRMLEKQPSLYHFCPDRQKLQEADSRYWVELLIRQPGLAAICPKQKLVKADEVRHLLLYRPELADMLNRDDDDPPVRLYIVNHMPDGMAGFFPSAWFTSKGKVPAIRNILRTVLLYGEQDAERRAEIIAHENTVFAGVYGTREAENIMKGFAAAVEESKMPLSIRKEYKIMESAKFIADGDLEKAVMKQQNGKIIRLTVEANSLTAAHTGYMCHADGGYGLTRPDILATEEFLALPLRTEAVIYECAMPYCLRQKTQLFMRNCFPESGVNKLLAEVEAARQAESSEEEEKLMRAILNGDDREIQRLIEKQEIALRSMTPERMTVLCGALKKLNPYSTVLLFAEGIHYASVGMLLKFLLRACERGSRLDEADYRERLMYANLLIHVLQEEITPEDDELLEEDWYPMGNSIRDSGRRGKCHTYSYYFDPQHLCEPRHAKKKGSVPHTGR